jgi:hypothetical protein
VSFVLSFVFARRTKMRSEPFLDVIRVTFTTWAGAALDHGISPRTLVGARPGRTVIAEAGEFYSEFVRHDTLSTPLHLQLFFWRSTLFFVKAKAIKLRTTQAVSCSSW